LVHSKQTVLSDPCLECIFLPIGTGEDLVVVGIEVKSIATDVRTSNVPARYDMLTGVCDGTRLTVHPPIQLYHLNCMS